MKRILWTGVLGMVLGFGASAEPLDDWILTRANQKVSDLTIGDLKSLAEIRSVERQEAHYVGMASVASFVIPGVGQFMTGDMIGGSLNLAGHVALVGGTLYGAWALLPSDLKASGLSRDGRRDLMQDYWHNDPAKLLPSAAVMVGGLTLSVIQRFWASADAKERAQSNIKSGAVTFEPHISDGFFGFRARM